MDATGTLSRIGALETKVASFERATSGIWKYEKRSDGTCVCEGQQTRTVNIENIYSGNIDDGDFAAVSFPSGLFTAVPDVRATIQSAPVTVWVATASNSKPSTSSTQTVRLLSGGPVDEHIRHGLLPRGRSLEVALTFPRPPPVTLSRNTRKGEGMAKLKYRGTGGVVELLDISNVRNRLSSLEAEMTAVETKLTVKSATVFTLASSSSSAPSSSDGAPTVSSCRNGTRGAISGSCSAKLSSGHLSGRLSGEVLHGALFCNAKNVGEVTSCGVEFEDSSTPDVLNKFPNVYLLRPNNAGTNRDVRNVYPHVHRSAQLTRLDNLRPS